MLPCPKLHLQAVNMCQGIAYSISLICMSTHKDSAARCLQEHQAWSGQPAIQALPWSPLRRLTLSMLFTLQSTSYQTTCTVSKRSSIKGTRQCKPTRSSSFALRQYEFNLFFNFFNLPKGVVVSSVHNGLHWITRNKSKINGNKMRGSFKKILGEQYQYKKKIKTFLMREIMLIQSGLMAFLGDYQSVENVRFNREPHRSPKLPNENVDV